MTMTNFENRLPISRLYINVNSRQAMDARMIHGRLSPILRHLRRVIPPREGDGVSDAQLLERFVHQNDEAAFELLLWRHGPMVWRLCRRILPDFQDAEDAFQAAMLVLARKAGSINKQCSLASWLYKVAFRIAIRARADSAAVFAGSGTDAWFDDPAGFRAAPPEQLLRVCC